MVGTWIQTDFDLGVPWKVFTLGVRQMQYEFPGELARVIETKDIAQIAKAVEDLIARERPGLSRRELCVVGVSFRLSGMWWEFTAIHPSFTRVLMGHESEKERLETCEVCHNPLPTESLRKVVETGRGGYGLREVEVCSQECLDARPMYASGRG